MGAGRSGLYDGTTGVQLPDGHNAASDDVAMGWLKRKPKYDWNAICDLVWQGKTVPEACEILGYEFGKVHSAMGLERSQFIVEVSMMASVKKEYLED